MNRSRTREHARWGTAATPSWTDMSPSDWMGMTPADWMEWSRTGWNQTYADWMNMRPTDWWTRMLGPGAGLGQGPATMPGAGAPGMGWGRRWEDEGETGRHHHHEHGHGHHHEHGEHCRRCGSDSCLCYCCIGDADLAVYTLLGEQRVIPIILENERHRETQVSLDLSPWTTSGGHAAPVETVRLEPQSFTLPACDEQRVLLTVSIRDTQDTAAQPGQTANAPENAETPSRMRTPDVDDCRVAYADLRLTGCDHRPLRIAVAILPRDCDPYRVSCGYTCC